MLQAFAAPTTGVRSGKLERIMSANTALNSFGLDLPAGASARQKLGHAVKCATLATPMEEWQPWQYRVDDSYVEVVTLAGRPSPSDDAQERELMVRCGTALRHLKLALKHIGCLGRIELFPNLDQPGLLARLHFGSCPAGDAYETALFAAMAKNPSAASNDAQVDGPFLAGLQDNTAGGKAWLEFAQSESSRNRLVSLAETRTAAPVVGLHRPAPPAQFRSSSWARPLLTFVVRGGPEKFQVETAGRRAEELAALAVIKTKTDDKHGWLAAGHLLAQLRLQARAAEISAHTFDQAFRDRRIREELRMNIGHKGYVQAIIGFGLLAAQWPAESLSGQADAQGLEPDTGIDTDFTTRLRKG